MTETTVRKKIMLALGSLPDVRLFRNNVGEAIYGRTHVPYGLCPGSSDIIGWRSITITPDMIGRKVAVFVALEVKSGRGQTSDAQNNSIERVQEAGGIAGICRSVDEAREIIEG